MLETRLKTWEPQENAKQEFTHKSYAINFNDVQFKSSFATP